MLKLVKIYLHNFKGIAETQIVDFQECDLTILNGPNGFGKTTIFDAIELCLRGKLERTDKFSHVQKNTSNYRKPFYQNSIGEDVVIKVLFKDSDTGTWHTIVKFLDKENNGKVGNSKAFKPDAWEILETYYSSDDTIFENAFDKTQFVVYSQLEIDALFYKTESLSHQNLYPLFNYLQQEENIYFLKKSEEEKKTELDFLFQTQDQANEYEGISFVARNLRATIEGLNQKIANLGDTEVLGTARTYLRLFPGLEKSYDKEEPFLDQDSSNLEIVHNAFKLELEQLLQFISSFDVSEYKKDKLRESIAYTSTNKGLLTAFVLQKLSVGDEFLKIEKLSSRRSTFSATLQSLKTDRFENSILNDLGFSNEFIQLYRNSIDERDRYLSSTGEIEKIVSELNNSRLHTVSKFRDVPIDILSENNCPLCNADWKAAIELDRAIDLKTQSLLDYNRSQLTRLDEINDRISTQFRNPISSKIEEFMSEEGNQLDSGFYATLIEYRGFSDIINRFKTLITANDINFDEFIIATPISKTFLNEAIEKLEAKMKSVLSSIEIDQNKLQNKNLFKDLFSENQDLLLNVNEVESKIDYVRFKLEEAKLFSLNKLKSRRQKLSEFEFRINKVKDELSLAIKKYKVEMIEKIKIPFYLYSGKILQNYQQGLGIFIDMQQNTNRVRFLTDNESDHDIIHHLSSGQLAVVSIAFCLALNKVYETSSHFKFIAIDDPVQTLDDINIHSFIELMRHEFSDFQIVMSTHEDDIASYLSYKFGVFDFKCNRINVQKKFYLSV